MRTGSERSKAQVLRDIRKVTKRADYTPPDAKDLCSKLLVTCYMASQYSGQETRERARLLAETIGCVHTSILIDDITSAFQTTFQKIQFHNPP